MMVSDPTAPAAAGTPRRPRRRRHLFRPPANEDWRARLAEAERAAEEAFRYVRVRGPGGWTRACLRITGLVLWTLLAIPLQALFVATGQATGLWGAARRFGKAFHQVNCWLFGISVRVVGRIAPHPPGRPVVFVCNHSSWLDVLVLGATLEAAFVAKAEVSTWPMIRTVAKLGRSVFVSRRRSAAGREANEMAQRLSEGASLVLFPEGTTSDGARVMEFRSAFFGVFDGAGTEVTVQPVSIVYDRLNGLPLSRKMRFHFAWYGDMNIGGHAVSIAAEPSGRASVLFHDPLDRTRHPTRKSLAEASFAIVAAGAASLRTGRPVAPPVPPSPTLNGPEAATPQSDA
jgi:1-acyl-sn-glycerol-3-phosphate acyltransferase